MPKLYEKVIVTFAQEINEFNTARLLNIVRNLLAGRKTLAQLLTLVVERNKLVDSLRKMLRLAMEAEVNAKEHVGDGDLGEFHFDEELVIDIGTTIAMHTAEIVSNIKHLAEIKEFPGLRYFCNTHDKGTLHTSSSLNSDRIPQIKEVSFIFNNKDLHQ